MKIVIFIGKSIYKRETVSNKNIGLVIELGYTSTIGTALLVWLEDWSGLEMSDWSPQLPYMADGTGHDAEKVGDTQQLVKKLTSSPSITSSSKLFDVSRNRTFSSSLETWIPMLVKFQIQLTKLVKQKWGKSSRFPWENRWTCLNTKFQAIRFGFFV